MKCHHCQKVIDISEKLGFREECDCGYDLHVCKNCKFYDESSYNECRETQADRILDKEKSNFCDYFKPSDETQKSSNSNKDDALAALESLFKK